MPSILTSRLPIDTANTILDEKQPADEHASQQGRFEHSLVGLAIGEVRDCISAPANTESAKEHAAQNEQIGQVAADVLASLPGTKVMTAGLVRGAMLIDPSKSFTSNTESFAINGVEGMTLNKAVKLTMDGTVVSNAIREKFGTGLSAEIATHLTSGAAFSAVRAGFDKQTWLDEKGNISLVDGSKKFAESTLVGSLINVPAGMAGFRAAKAIGANLVEGSASRMLSGTIAGATSGGVFNFTDSYMHTGDLIEAGKQFLIGTAAGAAMGGAATGVHEISTTKSITPSDLNNNRTLKVPFDETVGKAWDTDFQYDFKKVQRVSQIGDRIGFDLFTAEESHPGLADYLISNDHALAPAAMKQIASHWRILSPEQRTLQPSQLSDHIKLVSELGLNGIEGLTLSTGSQIVDRLTEQDSFIRREFLFKNFNGLTEEQKGFSPEKMSPVLFQIEEAMDPLNSLGKNFTHLTSDQVEHFRLRGLAHYLWNDDARKVQKVLSAVPELKLAAQRDEEVVDLVRRRVSGHLKIENLRAAKEAGDLGVLSPEQIESTIQATASVEKALHPAISYYLHQGEDLKTALKKLTNSDDSTEASSKVVLEKLFENNPDIVDGMQAAYGDSIKKGVETFGAQKMVQYIFDADRTLHNLLYGFEGVLDFHERSGVPAERFFNDVIAQAKRDKSTTEDGDAIARLFRVSANGVPDITEIKTLAQKYPDFKTLQNLVTNLPDEQNVFASWKNLEKFHTVQTLLENSKLMEQVQTLRNAGNNGLADWVEVLAFNQKSRVSTSSLDEFVNDPNRFFDREESHQTEFHDAKKPSNYSDIPHMDLTAEQLRDALTNGTLDKLQVFSPMTAEYVVGGPTLAKELDTALGSTSENRTGKAQRVGRLFKEVRDLLTPHGLTPQNVIDGAPLPAAVAAQLDALIYKPNIGMPEPLDRYRMTASIHRKSDPLSAIAGDETDCCMSFGTGKNNIYMVNPNDAIFTVRMQRPDGSSQIIAQSVLTKDLDVKTQVPELLQGMTSDNESKLHTLVPDAVLQNQKAYISGDNVEIRGNYDSKLDVIEAIYKDFFSRYIAANAEAENLHSDKMLFGKGFTDAMHHLPAEPNTFVPQAPPGYSDKTDGQVASLALGTPQNVGIRLTNLNHEPVANRITNSTAPGVTPLTFESTLPTAYLESKVFEHAPSLRVGIHNLENSLIAKDINNTAKGRPNLSLKYIDSNGKMTGYMLAYEGVSNINGTPTPAIFISDFSTLRDINGASSFANQLSSGKMLLAFGDLYKTHYLDKGRPLPIVANAKADTSFPLITNNLEKFARRIGSNFSVQELAKHERFDSTVHDLVLTPQSTVTTTP
ncbi:MAG TPA: hypothetical protein V6C76_13260 [Drouetiella sp.]